MTRPTDYVPGDFRLLQQTEIWVDRHGDVHKLEEMNIHHRGSLIPFLRNRADHYQNAAWIDYMSGLGFVDDPSDGVWAAQMETEAELNSPAEEWIERQPLMRRLIELDQRTPAQRRITAIRNRFYPLRKRLGLTK